MTVEIYESGYAGQDYTNYEYEAFEMATYFSGSSHFTIIDSYTTHWWSNRPYLTDPPDPADASYIPHRYKGDPIADTESRPGGSGGPYNVWHDQNDLSGDSNNWMVVQCETSLYPTLPKWQVKIQWCNTVGFADVSGVDYGREGEIRQFCFRFAPYGGWDLADVTPDFNPTEYPGTIGYRSSGNDLMYVGSGGTGDDVRWYFIVDDGQLLRFNRRNEQEFNVMKYGGCMGDIIPVDITKQVMPRAWHVGNNTDVAVGNNDVLPEISQSTGFDNNGGLAFEDASRNWVEHGYHMPDGQRMINYWSQPNKHSGSFQLDILPYFLLSNDLGGPIGTLPLVGRAYGPGFQLFDNKQWLSTKAGYTVVFKWDGSTDLSF